MLRRLGSALVVTLCLLGARPAAAQPDDNVIGSLSMLLTLRSFDLSCHRLKPEAAALFEAFFEDRVQNSPLTASQKNFLMGEWRDAKPLPDIDCRKKSMFDDGLAIFAKPPPNREPEYSPPSEAAAEMGLTGARRMIASLEPGRLTRLSGCHAGRENGVDVRLCLTRGGDGAMLTLQRAGVTCALSEGEVRKREAGAYFYAAQPQRKCSDGTRIVHAEGLCEEKGGGLQCLITVFEYANEVYAFRGTDDGVNLELLLRKVP